MEIDVLLVTQDRTGPVRQFIADLPPRFGQKIIDCERNEDEITITVDEGLKTVKIVVIEDNYL